MKTIEMLVEALKEVFEKSGLGFLKEEEVQTVAATGDIRTERVDEIYKLLRGYAAAHKRELQDLGIDSEDFVQDVMANIFRRQGLHAYDPSKGTSFETLIFRIAKNYLIDKFRAQHAKSRTDIEGKPIRPVSLDAPLRGRSGDTLADVLGGIETEREGEEYSTPEQESYQGANPKEVRGDLDAFGYQDVAKTKKLQQKKEAKVKESIDLDKYATIIEQAEGEMPPPEVLAGEGDAPPPPEPPKLDVPADTVPPVDSVPPTLVPESPEKEKETKFKASISNMAGKEVDSVSVEKDPEGDSFTVKVDFADKTEAYYRADKDDKLTVLTEEEAKDKKKKEPSKPEDWKDPQSVEGSVVDHLDKILKGTPVKGAAYKRDVIPGTK